MMKIALFGYGRMGKMIEKLAIEQNHLIISKTSRDMPPNINQLEEADVCIDFSHPDQIIDHIKICGKLKKAIVIGTTAWEAQFDQVKQLVIESKIGCLYSPNFSIGIALFKNLVTKAAKLLQNEYDPAIIELHHNKKIDSPSGTAKLLEENLAKIFQKPISISSVRCGSLPGTHEIYFDSCYDTIVLSHQARSREGFADGALKAAEWIIGKQGLYTLEDLYPCL